jgi:hypothetical protein
MQMAALTTCIVGRLFVCAIINMERMQIHIYVVINYINDHFIFEHRLFKPIMFTFKG